MVTNRLTMAMGLCALAAFGMVGCGKPSNDGTQGAGTASIAVHTQMATDQIASISLKVQSASKLPTALNVPLKLSNGQYSAQVNNLVAASDYIFTVDASSVPQTNPTTQVVSTDTFHGATTAQTVQANKTTSVTVNLSQVNPQGMTNSAPVIDTITFSPNQVAQGGTAGLTATAHDPDAGQTATLAFAWTAACTGGSITGASATGGSDSSDRTATATFNAPFANVDCQINLTVTDAFGSTNSAAISIRVGLGSVGNGNAKVSTTINAAPVITGLQAVPAQIVLGQPNVLSVTAVDPEGDTLSYHWDSVTTGCTTDNFSSLGPNLASPTIVVSAATGSACTFKATVSDGVNQVVSNLTVSVANTAAVSPPLFGLAYQSESTIAGGDSVVLALVATDPAGGSLTYSYQQNIDGVTTTTFVPASAASLGLDAIFTGAGTWTVPAGAENASSAVVNVKATSAVSGMNATFQFVFAPKNNACATANDGDACTISTDLCVTKAHCAGGACVADTRTTCSASTTACEDNVCNPATGVCGLVAQATGTACNDQNGCTTTDTCAVTGGVAGQPNSTAVCGGTTVACPAPTQCQTSVSCKSLSDTTYDCSNVVNKSSSTSCNADSLACTANDMCDGNGTCVAGANPCVGNPNGAICSESSTSPFYACSAPVCMQPQYAEMFLPPYQGLALGTDGTPWITGNIYNPFDFSTNTNACTMGTGQCITSSGSADVFVAKLNPATGLATVSATFGQFKGGSTDQVSAGIAVASNGNAAVVGSYATEIDFTAGKASSKGTNIVKGTVNVDYLTTTSATSNYVVTLSSAGASIKAWDVDLAGGSLFSVASNPSQAAFALCGRTNDQVGGDLGNAVTETAGGGADIVVAKIDAATGAILWAHEFGGTGDQVCQSVAMDSNGDVIIAGGYTGALQFGSLPAFATLSDSNVSALYVAKLASADGAPLAAATWGTAGKTVPFGLTVAADHSIILAGSVSATITMGSITLTDLGQTDAFVAKLNGSLVPQWAQTYGDANFNQQAKSVAVSSTGDVYVAGLFIGGLGTLNLTSYSQTNSDGFLAHLAAADGSLVCSHVYGDANGAQGVSTVAVARAASGALLDEVAIGGGFTGTVTFGSTKLDTTSPSISQSYYARLQP